MMTKRTSYFRFNINPSWDKGGIELYGCYDYPDRPTVEYIKPITLESIGRTSSIRIEPFAFVKPEDLQVIMDALWTAGIHPGCGEGHIGELNATKFHLEDMRKLVFEKQSN